MHRRTAERIAAVAALTPESVVLEIGPGTGMLTRELLRQAGRVIAVERDRELFEELKKEFAREITDKKLELVHDDIRSFNLKSLPHGYVVVANIPYYLTGELFRLFLGGENQPYSMTLLIQKEVADRIVAKKGSVLALSVSAYGTPRRAFLVPRGAFVPAPQVDSAVLTIAHLSRKQFASKAQEKRFFELLHAGFAHKRKYLRNNLASSGFNNEGIGEKIRAEELSLNEWLRLSRQ